jgi:hypothetical protein
MQIFGEAHDQKFFLADKCISSQKFRNSYDLMGWLMWPENCKCHWNDNKNLFAADPREGGTGKDLLDIIIVI